MPRSGSVFSQRMVSPDLSSQQVCRRTSLKEIHGTRDLALRVSSAVADNQ